MYGLAKAQCTRAFQNTAICDTDRRDCQVVVGTYVRGTRVVRPRPLCFRVESEKGPLIYKYSDVRSAGIVTPPWLLDLCPFASLPESSPPRANSRKYLRAIAAERMGNARTTPGNL